MDYVALKSEILNDPVGIGYAGKTPVEIRDLLAVASVSGRKNIPLGDLQAYLMSTVVAGFQVPIWWVLKAAAKTDPLAEMAFDYFNSRLVSVDTSLPVVQGVLQGLETAGVLDQSALSAIDAMANSATSRGELLFGRVPNVLEIQLAMLEG